MPPPTPSFFFFFFRFFFIDISTLGNVGNGWNGGGGERVILLKGKQLAPPTHTPIVLRGSDSVTSMASLIKEQG